jgi:putative ABC transport system permease protein
MSGWKPALRLARRDAWRHKGRSILVLVMIALPVLAVSAADVVYLTSDVNSVESLDRRLGSADALVTAQPGASQVIQDFDPQQASSWAGAAENGDATSLAEVRAALGRDVPATEWVETESRVDTERGVVSVGANELDMSSPLADGLFHLTAGRWPASDSEVAINKALADKGFAIGDGLTIHDGDTLTVVGTAESTASRNFPRALSMPGGLGVDTQGVHQWLIGGGGVSWNDVKAVNAVGAMVLSRAVIENPPPDSERPAEIREWESGVDESVIAVIVLIVVMALLEVVLLAGPAFAVGARRQSRTLALMAASGGTPKQARRVILAGGIVLGGASAVIGVILGVVIGWALLPVVQHFSDTWLGPFDVSGLHLLAVAAFGLLSAFLAAVVPAWIASRQDVVAVLAGRRGDRKPGLRSPLLGLVLLGVGIFGAVAGATQPGDGSILIAGSAVVSVLGMILLIPVVVVALARLARRLPLVARYAVRDAARHRTRTVPAVAAVAATVAGVVALGIANASDAAESEATYQPQLAIGMGALNVSDPDVDWDRYVRAVNREAPSVGVQEVRSYDAYTGEDEFLDFRFRRPDGSGLEDLELSYASSFGGVLAGADMLQLVTPVRQADLDQARAVLDEGGVVLLTSVAAEGDRLRVVARRFTNESDGPERLGTVELPAYFLQVRGTPPSYAVAADRAFDELGLKARTAGLLLDARDLSDSAEADLAEVVQGMSDNAYLYVERGYQADNETVIVLSILFGLGAVLMLGGTLTATFLALSDARPDLATLSAVGAAPRTRRGVAAAYALVVGFVGAVLGAAVGFIPGIAVTYPLTSTQWMPAALDAEGNALPDHFVDIPWSMIVGLVVVLPLVTAAIVGLTARSRLPLVARLD